MKVRLLVRAQKDIQRIDAWWTSERPAAPLLFLEELERALRVLEEQPEVGPIFGWRGERAIRRLLLIESRAHLYYAHVDEDTIFVLRVWRAVRGRPPALG